MRRNLITRRNLIRAGIAAPFVLPKYAEALTAKQVLTDLGGAGLPPSPLTYQSVWKDSFASLSLRTGGPTPAGLAAGKGIWADAGLYYNSGTGINARGIASFGFGWFVDHSFNWSAVDPNYSPLGQLDITSQGLVLAGGSNFPLIRNTLTPFNITTPPATGSAWFDAQGATGSTGTSVDGLPAPRIIVSGGLAFARREYFEAGNVVEAGELVSVLIQYNLGTSNSLFGQVDFNGSTSTFHVSSGVFTQDSSAGGTFTNVNLATVGSHLELSFQVISPTTGFLDVGAGPNSTTAGQTVIVYDFQVKVPPYLSALVSSLYSASIKPPFYRETVFTIPGGPNDWSAVWGLGVNQTFEMDDLEWFDPSYPSDQINSTLHTPQGSRSNAYRTGTPLAGRQITVGVQVTDQAVAIYYGGRNGVLAGLIRMPSGVATQTPNYSILDEDVGFPWIGYPVGITTPSNLIIRSVEYFAPASNTTGVFPPAPPVPVLTWGGSFAGGSIPAATASGTTVATLSGAGSYSLLGYSGLVISGSNVNTSGTLTVGSYNFYIQGLDGSGNPGIAPKLTATVTVPALPIAYAAEAENNTGQTSYTFTGVSIGAANPNRYSVVAVGVRSANAINNSTIAVTLDPGDGGGPRTATKVVEQLTGAGAASYVALFQVPTPTTTGTTATIVVSGFGSAAARCAIQTYAVTTSTPAIPSGSAVGASTLSGNNASTTITVPSGGAAIAGLLGGSLGGSTASVSAPASGITTDYNAFIGSSSTLTMAAHDTTTRTGSTTYTFAATASTSASASVAASWAP